MRKISEIQTMQEPEWGSGIWSLPDEQGDSWKELQAHLLSAL